MAGAALSFDRAGKRYDRRWALRNLSFTLPAGGALALVGRNGAGKSTAMGLAAGLLTPSEGAVELRVNDRIVPPERAYRYISWMAPAMELYPELSLAESYALHFRFRRCLLPDWQTALDELELGPRRRDPLRALSSGLLQRARLGLALYTDAPLLLLDEPTAFMDETGAALALNLLERRRAGRTLLLASNLAREYTRVGECLTLE